jgi:DNA-binding XRE family transcriptional regulator
MAIEARAGNLATLKDLRLAVEQTQQDLAATLGVGQDTISSLEKRSDMLLSTLRRYVEAMGGTLELVAQFPNRPPVVIDHLASTNSYSHAQRPNAVAGCQMFFFPLSSLALSDGL